jgi:hypothetical protein
MLDVKIIKGWLWDLAEITALIAAISILMSVLFGPNVPFFGNVVSNLQPLFQAIGEGGIAVIVAILVIVAIYARR